MQIKAERGYALPKEIMAGVAAGDDAMVICLDLQQALSTPKLSTNQVFYKRKLYTYNFGIHNYKTGRGYMFVWDEITANRGAAEIASCLYKFVLKFVPPSCKKLYIFSDNCPGQNKIYTLILFYLFLIHKCHFEEVYHIFFQVGHTYMHADTHFATIEKAIRKERFVFSPACYVDIIKKCKRKNPFDVTVMSQQDFFDFERLKERCTIRKPSDEKFSKACFYKVSKNYRIGYELAGNYLQLYSPCTRVRWATGIGKRADENMKLNVPLHQKYLAPLALTTNKINDLKTYVKDLVPRNIYESYWLPILNSAPSSETNDDGNEPLPFTHV